MRALAENQEIINGFDSSDQSSSKVEGKSMAVATDSKFVLSTDQEARQFRRLYMVCFMIFFMVALVGRLLPSKWRPWSADMSQKRSVVGEAKAVANSVLPYVFMA